MNAKSKEMVMVFRCSLFDALGHFSGFSTETTRYMGALLNGDNAFFVPRHMAERDEKLKQIIPYVIFRHGSSVLTYRRGKQSGEQRLVGGLSIGVGGHVNKQDGASPREAYWRAVRREINEEIVLGGRYRWRMAGLINDDSDPVGRVHFGTVHLCDLPHRDIVAREMHIENCAFDEIDILAKERRGELESWSVFCIDWLSGEKSEKASEVAQG